MSNLIRFKIAVYAICARAKNENCGITLLCNRAGAQIETHIGVDMAHSFAFAGGFQLVDVTTDELVRGLPKKQLWVAATNPEQAVSLVLAQVPEGWAAVLLDIQLEPEEAALLRMRPGDVRELTELPSIAP
jgi:hypothetical protein